MKIVCLQTSIPPQRMVACIVPPPLKFPVYLHTFPLKIWLLRHPPPLEFPTTIFGVGVDIFWSHTLPK